MADVTFDSFVSYRSFHEALKDLSMEQYGTVMFAINEYALNGVQPELNGVEKICFTLIKPQLDANIKRKIDGFRGGRSKNTEKPMVSELLENEKPMVISEEEIKKPMVFNSDENKKPLVSEIAEEKKPLVLKNDAEKKPNVNVNVNANANVNDNEKGNVKGNGECGDVPLVPPSSEYAKKIFDKFNENGLPCWNGNFVNFLQTDFKNTIQQRKGISSDDVLCAVDNYIYELKAEDSYINGELTFEGFVNSKLFNKMLPANYRHSAFTNGKKKQNKTLIQMAEEVLKEEADNTEFNPSILYDNVKDWDAQGQPHGKQYYIWQSKFLEGATA